MVKFVPCVFHRPVDVSSLPSLLSNVTWVAFFFINNFGAFIFDDTFWASFLFCILTSVYDIRRLSLCNADTTSLFHVSRWATIPKLKKKQKKKTRKIKIAEKKTIRPMRNPYENYYLSELVCLSSFLLVNTPNQTRLTIFLLHFGVKVLLHTSTMNLKGWVNCCVNGAVKFK